MNIIIYEHGAEKLFGYEHMSAKLAGEKQYMQSAFMSDKFMDQILESL